MKTSSKHPTYETNPITLLIESAKRAFSSAQSVALYLILIPIGLSIVQFILQTFSQVFSSLFDSSKGSSASVPAVIIGVILSLFALVLAIFLKISWQGFSTASGLAILQRKNENFGVLFGRALEKFMRALGLVLMIALYALPWWIAAAAMVTSAVISGYAGGLVAVILIPLSSLAALFFIFMAVRVLFRYALAMYSLFDINGGVFAALQDSKELTKGRLIEVFGVLSLGSIVPFLSSLLNAAGGALLYQQLKEHRNTKETLPKPHILNYLVIFLIGGVLLFVGLIALLVALIAHSN